MRVNVVFEFSVLVQNWAQFRRRARRSAGHTRFSRVPDADRIDCARICARTRGSVLFNGRGVPAGGGPAQPGRINACRPRVGYVVCVCGNKEVYGWTLVYRTDDCTRCDKSGPRGEQQQAQKQAIFGLVWIIMPYCAVGDYSSRQVAEYWQQEPPAASVPVRNMILPEQRAACPSELLGPKANLRRMPAYPVFVPVSGRLC